MKWFLIKIKIKMIKSIVSRFHYLNKTGKTIYVIKHTEIQKINVMLTAVT